MNQKSILFDRATVSDKVPAVPYEAGSQASKTVAVAIRPGGSENRQETCAFILNRGDLAATDEEIPAALGPDRRDILRPRWCELRDSRQRRPTHTGRGAAVWIATGMGSLSRDGLDRIVECLGLYLSTEPRAEPRTKRKPKGRQGKGR